MRATWSATARTFEYILRQQPVQFPRDRRRRAPRSRPPGAPRPSARPRKGKTKVEVVVCALYETGLPEGPATGRCMLADWDKCRGSQPGSVASNARKCTRVPILGSPQSMSRSSSACAVRTSTWTCARAGVGGSAGRKRTASRGLHGLRLFPAPYLRNNAESLAMARETSQEPR